MLNYRDMLRRYMDMVGNEEGTLFTRAWDGYFSEEEQLALKGLIDEVPQ